ncbi:MAG: YjjG family noncanonical pyrimidine nucleotidase [Cyclobacteriaceae bacterium]
MKGISYIFFDLDHTLWDYETNATIALNELYEHFGLESFFTGFSAFLSTFHYHNNLLWHQYNLGQIDRDHIRKKRFELILEGRAPINGKEALEMTDFFIAECPKKTALMPGTKSILTQLDRKYRLGIITNGFNDIQDKKLSNAGIAHYFEHIITSETSGHRKPSPSIFKLANELSGTESSEVVMIGDNFATDIAGAKAAGWQSIWYDPENTGKYEHPHVIRHLEELEGIL